MTSETYVIDSTGIIRYHGSIDDSQNIARVTTRRLALALDAVLAGRGRGSTAIDWADASYENIPYRARRFRPRQQIHHVNHRGHSLVDRAA